MELDKMLNKYPPQCLTSVKSNSGTYQNIFHSNGTETLQESQLSKKYYFHDTRLIKSKKTN